ncbi:MAG: nitrite/sulfite reductase [Victivallales bacterium]|nr:nitrite/sulfite reductase [Victivallales bacterium]MCF7889167.1 nitrite/sulfite reductase [Victivallales bacterium]
MEEYIMSPVRLLKERISQYINNEITANELKKTTAGFGIYLQRNKLFMIRVRITGGELLTENLMNIYKVVRGFNLAYIRLTTRQDIQLHDVPPLKVKEILDQLISKGFVFRGGGGDTFRNIAVSYDSGLSLNSEFDVLPYAEELTKIVYKNDKAFSLPRKIKIAFSSDENDSAFAKWSDIGFIAKKDSNNINGFEVFIGGGMGRNSMKAVKAFDFIPAAECFRCASAMIELFYKHGNRKDRSCARIRFLKEEMGEENFVQLFKKKFKNIEGKIAIPIIKNRDYIKIFTDSYGFRETECEDSCEYKNWKKVFTELSCWKDFRIVRVPVTNGNLTEADLSFLVKAFSEYRIKCLRINRIHELCFLIKRELLPALFQHLKTYKKGNFTEVTFRNHLLSCIGNTVCPIGMTDSQSIAREISIVLDKEFSDNIQERYRKLVNEISISGCGNSCGNPEVFGISVAGYKKKIDGVLKDFCRIRIKKQLLKQNDEDYLAELPVTELKSVIKDISERLK